MGNSRTPGPIGQAERPGQTETAVPDEQHTRCRGSSAVPGSMGATTIFPTPLSPPPRYGNFFYWQQRLGVTRASIPLRGIATALDFFEGQTRNGHLHQLSLTGLEGYLKAMDFSHPVEIVRLRAGKKLVGYRREGKDFGFFYSEPGTYLDRLGVDYVEQKNLPPGAQGPLQEMDRQFNEYRVKKIGKEVYALKSIASGVRAHDTQRLAGGGGTQYFIPKAWERLEILRRGV